MRKRTLWTALIIVLIAIVVGLSGIRFTGGDHYRNQVAVLTYHHIDEMESDFTISPDRLRDHLTALKAGGFHVISMNDLIAFLQDGKPVPPNAVVITFDDGYDSYYKYAYPELKRQGMPAVNFLIMNDIGIREPEPAFMTWEQIKEMNRDGYGFYSHTYASHEFAVDDKGKRVAPLTHRIYLEAEQRMETEAEYRTRVASDLTETEKLLREQLGNKFAVLCFPHGRYNDALLQIAEQSGIHYFMTGDYGLNSPGDKLIKRITAGIPELTGEKLVAKIDKETTLLGKVEDVLKNVLLKIRYAYF